VIKRVLFSFLIVVLAIALFGCASAAPAPAPQSNAASSAAPASQGPLSVPPQPTSAPRPTGVAVPYQTSVPAVIVSGPTLAPTNAPTAASPGPTATKAATTVPTAQPTASKSAAAASGVATGKKTEVKFTYTPALSTIEDADTIDTAIAKIPGIFDCTSSQTSTDVNYDAGLLTVDQIVQAFATQGHPVKPQ
jgi:copper chaperone CopZ